MVFYSRRQSRGVSFEITIKMKTDLMIIDDFMPVRSFKEYHEIVAENEPARVFPSFKELTLQEIFTFRILLCICSLLNALNLYDHMP